MIKKLTIIALTFLVLSLLSFSLIIPQSAFAQTCNASNCFGGCTGPLCNGPNICQTQCKACSNPTTCALEWRAGQILPLSACAVGSICNPGSNACTSADCTNPTCTNGQTCTGTKPNCSCQGGGGGPPPPPPQTASGCPVCPVTGETWDSVSGQCLEPHYSDSTEKTSFSLVPPDLKTCKPTELCYPGCGCNTPCNANSEFISSGLPLCIGTGEPCNTALGTINLNFGAIVQKILAVMLAIGGGLAVLLIILAGYRLVTSQGNPETTQKAREQLTTAIIGLLFIIFSLVIIQTIGVDILGIFPGK